MRAAAWLEEMMFILILCHAAPVPIIVTVILNQTVTVFFLAPDPFRAV